MSVAQTIRQQILTMGRIIVWSWGAHAYKGLGENVWSQDLGSHLGALVFKVQGRLFSGHVAIVLMPNDTYTVHFGSLRSGRFNSKQKVADVYFYSLLDVIDSRVETP